MKTKHITVPLERNVRQEAQDLVTEQNVDDPNSSGTTVSNSNQLTISSQSSTNSEPARPSIRSSQSIVCQPVQASMNSFIQKPITISKSKKIDTQISKLIIKHYHPFSLVEETEFKNLINLLAPGYTLPSRKTISNSLIPQLYESVVSEIKEKIKNIQAFVLLQMHGHLQIINHL